MAKKITKFTVYRKIWKRGEIPGPTRLLNSSGLCCLGFACIAAGCDTEKIINLGTPSEVEKPIPKLSYYSGACWDRNFDTNLSTAAMKLNDDRTITNREDKLRKLFKTHGIKVTFSDKKPPKYLQEAVKSLRENTL